MSRTAQGPGYFCQGFISLLKVMESVVERSAWAHAKAVPRRPQTVENLPASQESQVIPLRPKSREFKMGDSNLKCTETAKSFRKSKKNDFFFGISFRYIAC